MADLTIIDGDITTIEADVIVNAWNRNFIPFWLLIPQGVSRAIRRVSGNEPFWELRQRKLLKTGEAFLTSPGKHKLAKAIIHVAGINAFWFATEFSIRESTRNALKMARDNGFSTIVFPLIGAGTGSYAQERSEKFMTEEISEHAGDLKVTIVRFKAN